MYVLIAFQVLLISIASANPFHKYPYVFLLDIGNEELQKTNSEQLRVSAPGGSLALRYPAFGEGDTIAHVRVSGIDFGTDLKANVVDGGPGSKYVVIVFSGNQGTPYDAVMTIQTVSDEDMDSNQNNDATNDINNSAEELTDASTKELTDISTNAKTNPGESSGLDSQSAGNTNVEISDPNYSKFNYASETDDDQNTNEEIQPNYNSYSYKSANTNDDYENMNSDEDSSYNKYIRQPYSELKDREQDNDELEQEDNKVNSDINDKESEFSRAESQHSDFSDDFGNEDEDNKSNYAESNKYTKYQSLLPKLYNGIRVYPQNAVPFAFSDNSVYNSQDPNEVDQTFNDEEVHNSKIRDSNNNSFDSNDASAVES